MERKNIIFSIFNVNNVIFEDQARPYQQDRLTPSHIVLQLTRLNKQLRRYQ